MLQRSQSGSKHSIVNKTPIRRTATAKNYMYGDDIHASEYSRFTGDKKQKSYVTSSKFGSSQK